MSSPDEVHFTIDNGGHVYSVGLHKESRIAAIRGTTSDWDPVHIPYQNAYVGQGSFHGTDTDFRGNAVLLELDAGMHLLISDRLQLFATDGTLRMFSSLVGNAGVSSPMALTDHEFLDMSEYRTIRAYPIEFLNKVDCADRRALYSFLTNTTQEQYQASREVPAPVLHGGFEDDNVLRQDWVDKTLDAVRATSKK
jgi:hypothetical protein